MRGASLRTRLRGWYASALRAGRRLGRWSWRTLPRGLRRPFRVVDRFDSWAYLDDLAAEISRVLDDHAIEHLVLARRPLPLPRVILRRSQRGEVLSILARHGRRRGWWLATTRLDTVGRARPIGWRHWLLPGYSSVVVTANLVSPAGDALVHAELGVVLEFWTELQQDTPTTGGGLAPKGTLRATRPNGVIDHAGTRLWPAIQANGHRLPGDHPHLLTVIEPIDLVYTWVDGSDPAWLARKAAALGAGTTASYSADAAIDARFESRDELRYSLRSVEMYANWVRRIWVVTDRQVPSWLRQDERLRVVDHSEIFADPSVLPVFNSHAIESQLHHIPGLADQYLYLNDDMLFGAPVRPEDFFHGNGVGKFFTSPAVIDLDDHSLDDLAVTAAAKNNRDLVERAWSQTITNKLRHTPQPQSRRLLAAFEEARPEVFRAVMGSRFRSHDDRALPSSLSQYYAFAEGAAVTGRVTYGYLDLASRDAATTLELWLHRRGMQCLCINDSGEGDPRARGKVDAALRAFFTGCYPVPSRWEDRR
ncbi:MAG: Stealth CR1 domain-containing protein [Propionicimonas sp.]|nr:Stealth CR1 domain-containing protein [Propionicimonas sp.]